MGHSMSRFNTTGSGFSKSHDQSVNLLAEPSISTDNERSPVTDQDARAICSCSFSNMTDISSRTRNLQIRRHRNYYLEALILMPMVSPTDYETRFKAVQVDKAIRHVRHD